MKKSTQKFIAPVLISLLGGALLAHAQPTSVPASPTLPSGQVIALYNSSGTYTDIAGINYAESWGGWNYAGNYSIPPTVLEYLGLAYGGIGFEGNPQAVAGCTNLHMDVFTPNGSSFAIRLVDTSGHQADATYTTASGVITNSGWMGLDMPLSSFTAATPALNLSSIQQIGLIGNNPGETPGSDFYIDNIYFSASTNIVPPPPIPTPTNAAALPTRPATSVVAMYNSSGAYTDVPLGDWNASWSSAIESSYSITNTGPTVLKYNSLKYAGVEFYTPDQINVTNCNTMHVDIWTPNANQFGVQLVSLDNGGTQAAQVNFLSASGTIVSNKWVSLDIPLNQFTAINNSLDLSALQQLLWIDNQGGGGVIGGIFYIDNVYFYSNSVAPPPPPQPTNNAATPAWPAANVLAMYNSGGTYSDVSVNDWNASWSGSSESSFTITNTGNVVLQYGGLEYAGVEFYNPNQIDASAYNMMHVDVWTPNANQFGIQLVSLDNGGTQAAQVDFTPASGTITSNQWVALDIPLSDFMSANNTLDLTNLQQLLWIDNQAGGGLTGGIFYIDNVYFFTAPTLVSPQINPTVSAIQHKLSFATQNGFYYTVQYKTNLTDAVWQDVTTINGNNASQTVTDSQSQNHRFYRVWVH
jgi:hypothetical protein